MDLPNTYTKVNETGCCAVPDINSWDGEIFTFNDQHFIRMYTKSFLYMPINMAKIMKQLNETAEKASVVPPMENAMILSRDITPWKAEQLFKVTGPIENADNVELSGNFFTKVFEGPYKNAKIWHDETVKLVEKNGESVQSLYFFYTTCPKCAKHYGKNYVIAFAKLN